MQNHSRVSHTPTQYPIQNGYLKELGELFLKIEVTDGSGKKLSLDEGTEQAIQKIVQAANLKKKIIFIGNGGSAAISSHQSVDYWKNGGMRAIAFNDTSLLTCISNDYSYAEVFEKPMGMFADAGDVLIAISSSGKSENILRGANKAREMQCPVITLSGFKPDNPLRSLGELNFYVPAPPGAYGFVEISHLTLCHCFVDMIIQRNLIQNR